VSRNDGPEIAAAAGGQVIERWIGELRAPDKFEKSSPHARYNYINYT